MSAHFQSNQDPDQRHLQSQSMNTAQKQVNEGEKQQKEENREQPNVQSTEDEMTRTRIIMKNIRHKHPECIPVFYVKHKASPKQLPPPKTPFILFNKNLSIEQAMYNLYNQIQIKGLYFFCTRYDFKDKKMKYVIIKSGQTIQQIYNKYGENDHLTLIYGDKNIGMGGVNKMQKWLIRIMVFLLSIWLFIIAYPFYIAYDHGGISAVWDTFSLILTPPTNITDQPNQSQTNQSLNLNVSDLNQQKFVNKEDFMDLDFKSDKEKQDMWRSKIEKGQLKDQIQL